MTQPAVADPSLEAGRRLRVWHFVALVLAYVVVAQVATLAAAGGDAADYAELTSLENIVVRIIVPVGIGALLVLAFVSWVGSWQSIFVDRHRLPRLALVIPVVLLLTALAITNYSGLSEKGVAFTGLIFVGTMLVGFSEELVFRGVGVQALRQSGLSEPKVALWTSAIFGLSHGSNAIITGEIGEALVQVVLTTGTGFVFYLVMRATGALTMAMLFHGLWDFSALSTQVDPDNPSPLVNLAAVVLAVLLIGVLLLRRKLALAPEDS